MAQCYLASRDLSTYCFRVNEDPAGTREDLKNCESSRLPEGAIKNFCRSGAPSPPPKIATPTRRFLIEGRLQQTAPNYIHLLIIILKCSVCLDVATSSRCSFCQTPSSASIPYPATPAPANSRLHRATTRRRLLYVAGRPLHAKKYVVYPHELHLS